jgi:hypothetical protein
MRETVSLSPEVALRLWDALEPHLLPIEDDLAADRREFLAAAADGIPRWPLVIRVLGDSRWDRLRRRRYACQGGLRAEDERLRLLIHNGPENSKALALSLNALLEQLQVVAPSRPQPRLRLSLFAERAV